MHHANLRLQIYSLISSIYCFVIWSQIDIWLDLLHALGLSRQRLLAGESIDPLSTGAGYRDIQFNTIRSIF